MKNTEDKTKRAIAVVVAAATAIALVCRAETAYAQCSPLTSHVCKPETSVPHDYSFAQGINYWSVVGVIPTSPDDKDIYVYSSCGSGSLLGSSTGIDGIDFVVGDFNHNTMGTYYPRVTYGSASAFHNVYWTSGGAISPVSATVDGQLGGAGAGCNMIQIYDIFLEQNREYRFSFRTDFGPSARGALFRNPSTSAYWAGRSDRAVEILPDEPAYYTAPASDWYGLAVYPIWNMTSAGNFQMHVERLGDCISLSTGVCVNNKLYSVAAGPANDYSFLHPGGYCWGAVAVLPDTLDRKAIGIYTACDGNGNVIWAGSPGVGQTQFLIGDLPGYSNYAVRVEGWSTSLDYSLQLDAFCTIFPVPGQIAGNMSGLDPTSVCIKVWDLYLEAGKQYEFFFYQWGQKEPRLALFRNPGIGAYWASRGAGEWETGSGIQNYTATATDWYGLVVFADRRKEHNSLYQVQVQPLNDCEPLSPAVCEERAGWPRDFSFNQQYGYWTAVAVSPSSGDAKALSVHSQCDAKGGTLAYSANTGTSLVVGDFNHMPIGTYYPTVSLNESYANYTIAWDTGADIFPLNTVVEGSVGGTSGECGLVRIWDVFLNAGETYQIGFTKSGAADVKLALFRNPGNGTYWTDRSMAEWEYSESGNYTYTAPASDWYGLVAFPDVRGKIGSYSIRISSTLATGIDPEPFAPESFALYQNVPNPFNPSTTIRYDVPAGGGRVRLDIFDVHGRLVRTLVDSADGPGAKSVEWDGKDESGAAVSSGVYFYRLVGPGFTETRKMAVMK